MKMLKFFKYLLCSYRRTKRHCKKTKLQLNTFRFRISKLKAVMMELSGVSVMDFLYKFNEQIH